MSSKSKTEALEKSKKSRHEHKYRGGKCVCGEENVEYKKGGKETGKEM